MRWHWPVLLLAAAVAACGDIPQPFRHDGPPPTLARPKMGRGLTIRPILAFPDMAETMVKALEAKEVPATVNPNAAFGHVLTAEQVDNSLAWALTAADGSIVTTFTQPVPRAVWQSPDPQRLKLLATEAAGILSARLTDPDAQPRRDASAVEATRPKVRIEPIAGLPGDGDKALVQALRLALEAAGLDIVPAGGAYVVRGLASVSPAKSGDDLLSVAWQIRRAVDGGQMASINQEGEVPRGRLKGPWGGLARDIAEGGAAGIISVVRAAERSGKAAPEATAPAAASPPPAPSPFTEMRPADIGKTDSREQKTVAGTPPGQAKAAIKPAAKVSSVKPVKSKPVKGVKASPTKKKTVKKSSSPKPNAPRSPKVPAR
jgi:hypothetical protein